MTTIIHIYPESHAALCVQEAGKPYRPCNGSEGEHFIASWCGSCERDHGMLKGLPLEECDDNQICDIVCKTFALSVSDPDYPPEWQYGKDGQPMCTAFWPAGNPLPPERDELTGDLFAAMQPEGGANG